MTQELRNASDLLRLTVLSVSEGKRLGEIDGLLVRRETRTLAALAVGSGVFSHRRYLRFSHARSFGADTVMVQQESDLDAELPREELREIDTALSGRPVVTRSGHHLGEILDYATDLDTGKIESYRVQPEASLLARLVPLGRHDALEIPDAQVIALGADALVVRDEAATDLPARA
jgi:sporulation protein YlmC with PRC-barrel domain